MLLRVKSQRVALESNVFHRQLDELLELLEPPVNDSVHAWSPQIAMRHGVTAIPSLDLGTPRHGAASLKGVERAVTIMQFETSSKHRSFKKLDVTASNAEEAGNEDPTWPPWPIPSYDLEYTQNNVIGVGSFGEIYKATWAGTPVVVKFMGFEADDDAYTRKLFLHEL